MATFGWLLLLIALPITLAYWRANLLVTTGALGVLLVAYALLGHGSPAWSAVWGALFALLLFYYERRQRQGRATIPCAIASLWRDRAGERDGLEALAMVPARADVAAHRRLAH